MDLDELLDHTPLPNPRIDVDAALSAVTRRGRRRRRFVVAPCLALAVVAVVVSVALVGRANRPESSVDVATQREGGDQAAPDVPRVWRQAPSSEEGGYMAEIDGVLEYRADLDCFFIVTDESNRYPVVWPAETEGVAEGPGVRLADGRVVEVGDRVSGSGGYLPGGRYGIPSECLPPSQEAGVFNVNAPIEVTSP